MLPADVDAAEEEREEDGRGETPLKKPKTPKWKETQNKAVLKKAKAGVEESEAEAGAEGDAEVEDEENEQTRETPGLQAQVD